MPIVLNVILIFNFSTHCFSADIANLPEISIGTTAEDSDKVSTVECSKWEALEKN